MHFPDLDPYVFGFHPWGIGLRWYALAYVAGILLGWRYGAGLIKNDRIWTPKTAPIGGAQLDDLILWITLGVILGGRIGYILFYQPAMIWQHPNDLYRIWEGGMSFHGGFLGVLTAVVLFCAFNPVGEFPRRSFKAAASAEGKATGGLKTYMSELVSKALTLGDLVAPAAPIGLFFGRIANFVNGELWGRETDVPWGIIFCNDRLRAAGGGECLAGEHARHPSQLYEAGLEGLVLFLVLRWATHKAHWLPYRGRVTGLFMIGYGLARLALENVREPDSFMPDVLKQVVTMGMLLSLPMILLGAWLIWRSRTPAPAA